MNGTVATLALLAAWLLLGSATAAVLTRRGQPASTALSALVAWPVLLPLLTEAPRHSGPFATRIDTCFTALRAALADPSATGIVTNEELASLEQALRRADGRLAMVDRLLAEEALRADPLATQLDRARGLAADEVESVLRGVVQLRVQVGLVALAGDTVPVRDRLRELSARVRAIERSPLLEGEAGRLDGARRAAPAAAGGAGRSVVESGACPTGTPLRCYAPPP